MSVHTYRATLPLILCEEDKILSCFEGNPPESLKTIGPFDIAFSILFTPEGYIEVSLVVEIPEAAVAAATIAAGITTAGAVTKDWLGYASCFHFPSDVSPCFRYPLQDVLHWFTLVNAHLGGDTKSFLFVSQETGNFKCYLEIFNSGNHIGYIPLKRSHLFHNLNAYPILNLHCPEKGQFSLVTNLDRNSMLPCYPGLDVIYTQFLQKLNIFFPDCRWNILRVKDHSSRKKIISKLNKHLPPTAADHVINAEKLCFMFRKEMVVFDHVTIGEFSSKSCVMEYSVYLYLENIVLKLAEAHPDKRELLHYFSSTLALVHKLHQLMMTQSTAIYNAFITQSEQSPPRVDPLQPPKSDVKGKVLNRGDEILIEPLPLFFHSENVVPDSNPNKLDIDSNILKLASIIGKAMAEVHKSQKEN